jgi:hypothetical protein
MVTRTTDSACLMPLPDLAALRSGRRGRAGRASQSKSPARGASALGARSDQHAAGTTHDPQVGLLQVRLTPVVTDWAA